MSSILKALKKVEKENGPHKGGTSPVAREILTEVSRPERKSTSRSRLPLFFLLLLGGGILGGVLLMRDAEISPVLPEQQIAEIEPVTAPEVAVVPPVIVAESVEEPLPVSDVAVVTETLPSVQDTAPNPLKIAEEVVITTRDATEALKDTAASLRDTADALKDKVIVSSQASLNLPSAEEKTPIYDVTTPAPGSEVSVTRSSSTDVSKPVAVSNQVPVSVASRTPGWHLSHADNLPVPELNVSEIHWRPVAKDRLAVVNDLPVLEGVDIEGARVDRIFKDRIRFVINGRYLEVKVGSEPDQ